MPSELLREIPDREVDDMRAMERESAYSLTYSKKLRGECEKREREDVQIFYLSEIVSRVEVRSDLRSYSIHHISIYDLYTTHGFGDV
ncbi:hypothetical protein Tco_0400495 [Tanacetum coccineum]